jgi:Zn-dependent peptidase ImmA (M78 family)
VPHGKAAEHDAQAFAAALLMPRGSILTAGLRNAGVDRVLRTKGHWKVAAMALTHRLHELDLMTEWGYRDACVRLSQMGYRSGEPNGAITPESSQILAKVFRSLRGLGLGPADVAQDLRISQEELNRHVFGLVPLAVQGGRQGRRLAGPSPDLRVLPGGVL